MDRRKLDAAMNAIDEVRAAKRLARFSGVAGRRDSGSRFLPNLTTSAMVSCWRFAT
jgi:hypothetical protein